MARMSTRRLTRRQILQAGTAAGLGYWVAPRPLFSQSRSPNEKLDIGVIGCGGQGWHDLNRVSHENIVALCDVDERMSGQAREAHPKARFFHDYRLLLQQRNIDAVLVAAPDHIHAPATLAVLKAGKHVYCEKPLTHTVREARIVAETARNLGLVTQMGTQIHGRDNYRRVVEVIRAGAIGTIGEVHVWVGSVWSGGKEPPEPAPVPEKLKYDLWLGPAPYRPYSSDYLPAKWRGWWDFGGGALADMACHYTDLPFWALGIRTPGTIEAEGPPVHPQSAPDRLKVTYAYPAHGEQPPVTLTWYNGKNQRPPHFAEGKLPKWGDGVLFIGSQGMLLANYDRYVLLPEEKFADFQPPPRSIPDSIGHYKEWTEACKGNGKTLCHFDYAGPLTEAALLGNVAYRSGRKIEWDAKNMRIPNAPEAERWLDKEYREGWIV